MRLFSFLLAFAFLLAASAPVWPAQSSPDDRIHDQVLQRLAADRDVKGGGIDVVVKDGVVTLRGKVREDKQKAKAERIARKVKGVKSVVNELATELPETKPAPPK